MRTGSGLLINDVTQVTMHSRNRHNDHYYNSYYMVTLQFSDSCHLLLFRSCVLKTLSPAQSLTNSFFKEANKLVIACQSPQLDRFARCRKMKKAQTFWWRFLRKEKFFGRLRIIIIIIFTHSCIIKPTANKRTINNRKLGTQKALFCWRRSENLKMENLNAPNKKIFDE